MLRNLILLSQMKNQDISDLCYLFAISGLSLGYSDSVFNFVSQFKSSM